MWSVSRPVDLNPMTEPLAPSAKGAVSSRVGPDAGQISTGSVGNLIRGEFYRRRRHHHHNHHHHHHHPHHERQQT
jgi:hypothetical protein